MKKQSIWNHLFQEGVLFLLLGGALLWHSLDSHHQLFNQDWAQSPYLFPALVSVMFGILAISLLVQGILLVGREKPETQSEGIAVTGRKWLRVLIVLALSLAYYFAMAVLKIPYITFGIFSWSLTISNFEIVSFVFLIVLMLYLEVRKPLILALVPLGTTLFLSIAFRAMLHVLLP